MGIKLMLSVLHSWAISLAHVPIIYNLNSHIYNPSNTLNSQSLILLILIILISNILLPSFLLSFCYISPFEGYNVSVPVCSALHDICCIIIKSMGCRVKISGFKPCIWNLLCLFLWEKSCQYLSSVLYIMDMLILGLQIVLEIITLEYLAHNEQST